MHSVFELIRRRPVLSAVYWVKHAWQLFAQAPWLWIQLTSFALLLNLVGRFNSLLLILAIFLNPFITAGFYKVVVAIQRQEAASFALLFKPLQQPEYRPLFLRLAGLNFLLAIPLSLFYEFLVQQVEAETVQFSLVFLFVFCTAIVWMMFSYAVAIVYFLAEKRLLSALMASLVACWRNLVPLIVFGILALALSLATVPTFFLGMILVLPLLSIAFLLSFEDIFSFDPRQDQGQDSEPPAADDVLEV